MPGSLIRPFFSCLSNFLLLSYCENVMLECSAEENRTVLLELIKNPPNLYTYSYQQNKCISLYLSSLFSSLNLRRNP